MQAPTIRRYSWSGEPMPPRKLPAWQPGEYGRGIVGPLGSVYAWDEDAAEHSEVQESLWPAANRWSNDRDAYDPQGYFYIGPRGQISAAHNALSTDFMTLVRHILDSDDRLTFSPDRYNW
jgi:hypothetical protein